MATHTITSTEAQDATLKELGLKLSGAMQVEEGALFFYDATEFQVEILVVRTNGTHYLEHADIDMDGWQDVTDEEDSE